MLEQQAAKTRRHVTFNAPVVLGFVAACVVATLAGQLGGRPVSLLLFMTYRSSLLNPLTYLRLFTHIVGHGSWQHLTGNMVYILLLGPLLEEKYGSHTLFEVMIVTALSTALVNAVLFPHQALCGASGVVFAFILLSSLTSFREGEIPLTFILVAVLFLGQEVLQGVFVSDNVSNLSHIVGGIVGAAAGFALARPASER